MRLLYFQNYQNNSFLGHFYIPETIKAESGVEQPTYGNLYDNVYRQFP